MSSNHVDMAEVALIPQFYAGRSVFVTGASGFLGKVLLERLLSTCPDIGRLYLLLRTKKDVPPEQRVLEIKQSEVFAVLRKTNPSQLDKLVIIPGDTSRPHLDISNESMGLIRNVSIVFHVAATLRFDEELKIAVDQNVRSVIRLMEICDQLPNVKALLHVSTAYCHTECACVQERVYPAPRPLAHVLALVHAAPHNLLQQITTQYIHPKPNTYTFTKAVAESAVEQHRNRNYSVAVFRPSIVVSSYRHPVPGWIENLNGPSGVIVAMGKGILHVFSSKRSARADLIPVDIAIDTLIAAAWETAVDRSPEVKVYNCSSYENPITWGFFEDAIRKYLRMHPMDGAIWYPTGTSVEGLYTGKALHFLLQTTPVYLIEYTKRLLGIKSKLCLITVDQRLQAMNRVLRYFSIMEWKFETGNVKKLNQRITSVDRAIYNLDPCTINWEEHMRDFVKGSRKFILKENDQDVEKARRHVRRMGFLHNGFLLLSFLLFLRFILQNNLFRELVNSFLRLLLTISYSNFEKLYMKRA